MERKLSEEWENGWARKWDRVTRFCSCAGIECWWVGGER